MNHFGKNGLGKNKTGIKLSSTSALGQSNEPSVDGPSDDFFTTLTSNPMQAFQQFPVQTGLLALFLLKLLRG